jgi:pimeloyl-ACP methyl ester carboxylesterase
MAKTSVTNTRRTIDFAQFVHPLRGITLTRVRKSAAVFGAVILALGALVGVNWTPDRSVESLRERWAPAPSKFLTIDGMSVHLRDEGPGDDPHPIVLIHGTSSSLLTWEGWVASLKGQHRVVSFDLPGAGLTGPFPDDDYGIEHYRRFIGDFLDRLRIKHATLVGNSLGGRVAWETTVARPDLADRLVLIDARGYPSEEAGPPPIAVRIAQVPVLGPLLIEHITPRSLIAKSLMKAYGDPQKLTSDLVNRYYELLLRAGNRRALILQIEQESYADSDRIKTIKIPTLIIWGGLDQVVPVPNAERFHLDIAQSQLVVFRQLGHVPQEEEPAQTVKALKDFLSVESHEQARNETP